MKVAIVYDRVNRWGGAERVLLTLHEMFPDAPLYTSVYDPELASWAKVFPSVKPSFLNKIPFTKSHHEWLGTLMPIAFESFRFDDYDFVISVSSEAAKGIIAKPKTVHICYCLTPTRYLWSHYDEYFKGSIFKAVTKPVVSYLRTWDKIAAQRPDVMIAISTEVENRIYKYYKRNSEIIFPPVEVAKFKKQKDIQKSLPDDYYLIVSRLRPYKKVDLAISAFNDLELPLVIVGIGNEEEKLKSISKGNIRFEGLVSDEELVGYYHNAKAFIFPQEEDFGITPVEAQAMGCPVVAYKKGGALDTVIDGETGVFFERQDKYDLMEAVKRIGKIKFDKKKLTKNAEKYSKERFKMEFLDMLKRNGY
ncbi:MAG TPA: glycosyltransferase, partial [Candidatus Humimicrobiaceae bacterium]|nr:glycosyltransferase [Candidatus Humimicrobiaceae bacterium]